MGINNLIDRLNNELERLNKLKEASSNVNSFFTDNLNYNDDLTIEDIKNEENNIENVLEEQSNSESPDLSNLYPEIEPNDKETALTLTQEKPLTTAQYMFKKSIRVSLKSFLISLSLSFLNLFI